MPTKDDFLLQDGLIFLNHGSFGACPRPVFARYQAWQLELERQPVAFLWRRGAALMAEARAALAAYLHVPASELAFVTNATAGMNIALRSLPLQPGDEILTSNHEYGAINRLLEFVAAKTGARIVAQHIPLPYTSDEDFVDALFDAAGPRTKVIVLSHITSPTALCFPVEQVCRRARELGILTAIDGAHSPGQIPLDLAALGADMYSGNCHKWMCAPKGSAFLHVRAQHHALIEPLVISHGWKPGSSFVERNDWGGTRDIAAFLTVPAAIDYLQAHSWESLRRRCHALALHAQNTVCQRYSLEGISRAQFAQMVTIPLPACDPDAVKERLLDEFRIEIPVLTFEGQCALRLSVQAYNTAADVDALLDALEAIFG